MTSSSINHRRALRAAAATGLVGTLFVIGLDSASAMPGRDDSPPVPAAIVNTVQTHGHYVEHGCFITPHAWIEALAGPLPRCYTYVP